MRSWIWRISAVLAVLLGLTTAALAQEPLTPAQFRDRYVAELTKAAPGLKIVVVSETELKLIGEDGEEKFQFLENAYRSYRANPEALEEVLARHVRVASALREADGPRITARNAIVLVRSVEFLEAYDAMRKEKGTDAGQAGLAHRKLPGGLVAIIAADQPDSYQYPDADDIVEALGPIEQAWKIALANTPGLIGKADGEEVGGLVLLTTPQGGVSSLLAVDEFWVQLEKTGLGAPVVLATGRDTLVIGFEGRKDSVRDLKLVARGMVEEPGEFDDPMLSSALLAWRNGRWELYAEYPYQ